MATEAHGDDTESSTNAKLAHSQSATYRCAVVEEWRVNIDTVFEIQLLCIYITQPQNLKPCGMRKMLWIATVQTSRCICQKRYVAKCKDRAKITRFLGSNNCHSRSRHFDVSVGPDSARNFSGVATFGVDYHVAADAQVALKQKHESRIEGCRWRE